jgi:hypothetical protein
MQSLSNFVNLNLKRELPTIVFRDPAAVTVNPAPSGNVVQTASIGAEDLKSIAGLHLRSALLGTDHG